MRTWMAAAVIAAAAVSACAPPPRPAKTAVINIDQLAFGPAPADLHVGDTVQWVNHDMFEHTATAKDGSFDIDLPPGAAGKVVLQRSGAIAYDCKLHPGMTGTLNVAN